MKTTIHILMLEDMEDDANLTLYHLEQQGLHVDCRLVETKESFEAGLYSNPDLIIADYDLPQFNGLSALHLVRDKGLDIPFIFLSGTFGEEVVAGALALGADDFLMKDRLARLTSSIQRALDQKRLRDEKKRADAALAESERRLRSMMENVNLIAIMLDVNSRITFCNDYLLDITDWQRHEIMGRSWFEVFEPGVETNHIFMEAIQSKALPIHYENFIHTRTGEKRLIYWNNSLLYNEDGSVSGTASIGEDITERKHAERALYESETRYRNLVDGMLDGVYRSTHDGHFVDVNPAMIRMFGYENKAEMLAINIKRDLYFSENDRESLFLDNGDEKVDVFRMRRKDGTEIWVEDHGRYVHDEDGNVKYHEGILREVTVRKHIEDALFKSEELYRLLAENSSDFVALINNKGRVAYVSPGYPKYLGYEEHEFINSGLVEILRHMHPQDLPRVLKEIRTGIEKKIPFSKFDYRVKKKNGEYIWLEDVLQREFTPEGDLLRVIVNSRDVSDRKLIEQSLYRKNESLSVLRRITLDLLNHQDMSSLLNAIVTSAAALLTAQHSYIFLPDGGQHVLSAATPNFTHPIGTREDMPGKGVLGEVWRTMLPFTIENYAAWEKHDPEYLKDDLQFLAAMPIINKGLCVGVLGVARTSVDMRAFTSEEMEVLEHFAELTALVLENANLYNAALNEIRERKTIEEILRNSQQMYLNLVNTIEGIVWEADAKTFQFNFVSEQAVRLLGYPAKMWKDPDFWTSHIHPEDEKWAVEFCIQKTREKAQHSFEYRMIAADERVVWLRDLVSVVVENDEPVLLRGIMVDITERKQADLDLAASHDRFERLVEQLPIGIQVFDSNGLCVNVNLAHCEIFGVPAENLVGVYNIFKDPLAEMVGSSRAAGMALNGELVRMGDIEFDLSMGNPAFASGGRRIINVTIFPVFSPTGEVINIVGINEDITDRTNAEKQIEKQYEYLRALHTIDMAISTSTDVNVTVSILLDQALAQLKVDAASIILFNSNTLQLERISSRGALAHLVNSISVEGTNTLSGRVVFARNMLHLDDNLPQPFVFYYGLPLTAKGKIIGVLETYHASILEPDDEWIRFLEMLANQAAIAIDNAQLFTGMQRSNLNLSLAYDATIEGWSRAMEMRDHDTEGHTRRVTDLSLQLAKIMGVSSAELVQIRRGALLHDIGKLGVPDSILLKPGKLTEEETNIMHQHPAHAYEMLLPIQYLKSALDIPYCHHEKWDGTGYPRGLKGEEIPLSARIFAIVDVWDALRSDRPYRDGWSAEKTLDYIRAESGKHFDPQVVEAFLSMDLGE